MEQILKEYFEKYCPNAEYNLYSNGEHIQVTFNLENEQWAKNSIRFKEDKMLLSVFNSLGKTTWDIVQRHQEKNSLPQGMTESFFEMFRLWDMLIKERKEIKVVLLSGDIGFDFGHDSIKLLKESRFIRLNYHQRQFIKGMYNEYRSAEWIIAFGPNEIIDMLNISGEIIDTLENKKKEDITLTYDWKLDKAKIQLYYHGTEKTITCSMNERIYTISFDEYTFEIQNKEEVKEKIDDILNVIGSENPLPKKHYTDYMDAITMRKSMMDEIHELLLKNHSAKEIEEYAVKRMMKMEKVKNEYVYDHETKLFAYLNTYFVLDFGTKKIEAFQEKEEAITLFRETVLKKENEKLEKRIGEFTEGLENVRS